MESELIILRVAHLRGSTYEEGYHRRIGTKAGLAEADLDRVVSGPDAVGWTPRQRALLTAVDELLGTRTLGDATWSRLREHLDEREAIELILLAGHYDMLAAAIDALRIDSEPVRRGT